MKGLLVVIIIHAFAATAAHGQEPLLAKLKGVKDLKVSLGADAAEPSVRMLCGEIGIERARVGFLRVGLLPLPVIRSMELQLRKGAACWASDFWAYAEEEDWLRHASVRDLKMTRSDGRPLLTAAEAKFNTALRSLDLRNISLEIGGFKTEEKFARIRLQGPKEGILVLPDKEIRVIDLPDPIDPRENH